MAEIVVRPRGKAPETHYFLFENSSTDGLPLPPRIRAGLARKSEEVLGFPDTGGRMVFIRRMKEKPHRLARLRGAVRRAAASMRDRGIRSARFVFPEEADPFAEALLAHLFLADYDFDRYRGTRRRVRRKPLSIEAAFASARPRPAAVAQARAVADAAAWVRDLGNTPANDLGVRELTRLVSAAARRERLGFRALTPAQIRKERMGGVLGVAAGSRRPPGFLILEHRPRRARARVVLVGKGITFDSGGLSIKPAASMGEMKFDMMGAATALAIVRAVHRLNLPIRLTALAPVAENVPSGTSYRPGDILTMRNGKTVEVDNTDAEGRLILADALSYAEKFSPDLLIDFATLTGAVVVSLGHECAGLMTESDAVSGGLIEAGQRTGDRFWRLPLWDDYREQLKSDYADMKNVGGRWGGALTAAIFLKEFVPKGVTWAHCDIAGMAYMEKEHAGYPAGGTGFGIAAVVDYLARRFAE
jgi:leucyl aminopeptidase